MNIKEKIRKLLALSQSPNENEARDAMLKAKELMIKNKLSEADFEVKETNLTRIICEDIKWTTDSGNIWMTSLCDLICDNYLCVASWKTVKGSRTHTLCIDGLEEDAELCKTVIEYAIDFVISAIRILQKRYKTKDPKVISKSYAQGFILGLEMAFEEQKDEHPEWGLVAVKPKELEDLEFGTKTVKSKNVQFDPLAYTKGQNDGSNFNAKRVLVG